MPNPNFPQMKEELNNIPEAEAPVDMFAAADKKTETDDNFSESVQAAKERVQDKVEDSAAQREISAQTAQEVSQIKADVIRDQLEGMRKEDQNEVPASQKKPFNTTLEPAHDAENMMTQAQMNRADSQEAAKRPLWKKLLGIK